MAGPIQSSIGGAITAAAAGVAVAKAIKNQEEEAGKQEQREKNLEAKEAAQKAKVADALKKKEEAEKAQKAKEEEERPMKELQANKALVKEGEAYIKAHGSLPWGTRGRFRMFQQAVEAQEAEQMKKKLSRESIKQRLGGDSNG